MSNFPAVAASPPKDNSPRILIVDDEYANRAILAKMLSAVGYVGIHAEDGLAALSLLDNEKFDTVLLDIKMPKMDGFEVLAHIRQKWSSVELPVIMVTASQDNSQVVRALELEANDYLFKPVDREVMRARIDLHLRFKESLEALKKSEERYSLAARGTNDGLWDWDIHSNEVYYSPRWREMLAIDPDEEATLGSWLNRVHDEDRQRVESELTNHLEKRTTHFEVESRLRHADGSFRWMLCRGLAVWDEAGQAHRMAGSLTDITEGKVADALTGLPNRVLFRERLDRCVSKNRRDKAFNFGLMYLDLDNFKLVNDSLGHEAGDRLLCAVARRLESALRESDSFVSRLGGDEFAVLVEGLRSIEDSKKIASRIIESVSAPISLGAGKEVFASVSVGISTTWNKYTDAAELIQSADTAMYEAKEQGKSCFRIFDPVMREDVTKRLNLESELRRAIENQDLFLHYQPIVDIRTSALVGFEALVRWNHEELGWISPAEFIPIAEDTGLIVPIGKLTLQLACNQLASWSAADERFANLQVSVNLSNRQMCDARLVDEVTTTLQETGLRSSNLRLEVTESSIMQNPELGAAALSKLQKSGVKVAIDDFGTGYSSLAYIHELAPDVVKIDRSFVDSLVQSVDKQTIVTAILALADGLNLDVVAEGVETEQQRNLLASMGCRYAQGFLFSKPLPPEELAAMIAWQGSPVEEPNPFS